MKRDPALREQLDYYRARAPEYDQWWQREGRYDRGAESNARWFADVAEVDAALEAFEPGGNILELAGGTGIWSSRLLPFAANLTVLDGSSEMLERARRRLRSSAVRYIEADIYEWEPAERYDLVFFSFWLSHVPPARFHDFWELVGRCLAADGRVFFLDSRYEQTSTAKDHRLPDAGATILRRRLNNGSEYRIYKIFYDAPVLAAKLGGMGWSVRVKSTDRYFIYGQGRREGGHSPP
jgi:SAM-dependent methyltransferase